VGRGYRAIATRTLAIIIAVVVIVAAIAAYDSGSSSTRTNSYAGSC